MSASPPPAIGTEADEADARLERLAAWDQLVQTRNTQPPTSIPPSRLHNPDLLPSQRAPHLPSSIPTPTPSTPSTQDPFATLQRLTRLRLKSPPPTLPTLLPQLLRCRILHLPLPPPTPTHPSPLPPPPPDHLLIAVLSSTSPIRHTGRGEKFVVWTLSDLGGQLASCCLFGEAFGARWREVPGAVLLLANPRMQGQGGGGEGEGRGGGRGGKRAGGGAWGSMPMSVSLASQVLVLGEALDFAYCAAFKAAAQPSDGPYGGGRGEGMERCRNVVDARKGSYCDYHVAAAYRRTAGARVGLNKSFGERGGLVRFGDRRGGEGEVGISGGAVMQSAGVRRVVPSKPSALTEKLQEALREDAAKLRSEGAPSALKRRLLEALSADAAKLGAKAATATVSALSSAAPTSKVDIRRSSASLGATASTAAAARPLPAATTAEAAAVASVIPLLRAKRPRPLSSEERARELRRLKALQQLQQHGPVEAPDPNDSAPAVDPQLLKAQGEREREKKRRGEDPTIRLSDSGDLIVHPPPPSSTSTAQPPPAPPSPPNARRRQLEALFGPIDLDSAQGRSLLSASSAKFALLESMKEEERREYLDFLADKEALQLQMQAITEKMVTVWQCVTPGCGKRSEVWLATCRAKDHELERREGTKRWFECGACFARATVIDRRLPMHCCHQCGKSEWKQSGMMSERAGMAASVRSELQHKSEETFSLRSLGGSEGIKRNDLTVSADREQD